MTEISERTGGERTAGTAPTGSGGAGKGAGARERKSAGPASTPPAQAEAAAGAAAKSGGATAPGASTGPATAPSQQVKTVNLALQGGGAHGAFAWGVLDRLLEEPQLAFEGVTATSAGAMNAVVLAHGLGVGGREGARAALHQFWHEISAHPVNFFMKSPFEALLPHQPGQPGPSAVFMDLLTRLISPYQFNPMNFNPLREVLLSVVDFDALSPDQCHVDLHLSATNVRTGKIKIFRGNEISVDAVMASACLPFLFQTVEIDGEGYWDGGYMGNPAIYPLIYHCDSRDVVIVHINPMYRAEIPKDASSILNRINEISFNSSLMREMRTIHFVTDLIDRGQLTDRNMKRMLIHSLGDEETMRSLGVFSKLDPDWDFLCGLRDKGRAVAETWLGEHFADVGVRSSVDIADVYL